MTANITTLIQSVTSQDLIFPIDGKGNTLPWRSVWKMSGL